MATLCLFDIDGTLLCGEKQHHAAFRHAWKKVYGVEVSLGSRYDKRWLPYQGKTDRKILLEVARENGVDRPAGRVDIAIGAMGDYFAENWRRQKVGVLPGARRLLKELKKKNIKLGIVTGNVERIGRKKLKIGRLNHFFPTGSFGNEANDRSELVSAALKRAKRLYQKRFDRIFFFGDTIRDIKAGKKCNVQPIGVATGMFDLAELKKQNPYKVFGNLADTEAVLHALGV